MSLTRLAFNQCYYELHTYFHFMFAVMVIMLLKSTVLKNAMDRIKHFNVFLDDRLYGMSLPLIDPITIDYFVQLTIAKSTNKSDR